MKLLFELLNEEDISFLENFDGEKRDKILRTAITIGLKSIQMSEVNMDCHSYFDPLKSIIENSNQQNTEKIGDIDDKLDALLHIRTNSSRKGRLSEDLCIQRLIQRYPSWDISDVTYIGHEGDCRAKTPFGELLYEFKSYDTNVNREQINKFYKDLETTGIKYGIFVSNTSGIVGKKDLEWEIINKDTLVIYISNTGFNGQGCIVATELLIALIENNIMDKENHWLLHQNYETDEIYRNLVDTLDDYRSNNEIIFNLRKQVKEYRSKNNSLIDNLESTIFRLSLNTENNFSKMLGLVENIKSKQTIVKTFDLDEFIVNHNFNDKFIHCFKELNKIIENLGLTIHTCDNEWLLYKDDLEIAKTKVLKSKIQLCISSYPERLTDFNPQYEEFKDKKIVITLNDNYKIWELISLRLN
tara:strand:+ start:1956 stop:3197 length:1242 start_codon:yes stop_codon:yes gene_type:complete